jgi:tetratricopeptide (TPR) repeat protein/transcriptional regulator with XRE-family HTH domain
MRNPGRRRPLPAGLTQPEREFFEELRRLIDIAGLSYRELEELTSSCKPDTDNPHFYSKSQWSRWLNGQSRPPRNAVRKLADVLTAEDVGADHLLDLWSRTMTPPSQGASPAKTGPEEPSPAPAKTLIGRDSELARLAGLVQQVIRGRGGVVLIEGEPGIGKSALVRAASAEASEAGCQVFWGTGDELGQELPLLPFLDGLRVRAPSANPRRNTIVRLLRGEVATDRGADVPAVLAEQLLALVTEECAVRPVVLVVDDLQWADPASLALWGRLARLAGQAALLLVGMMRPVPQRENLLALRRAADDGARLTLDGLAWPAVVDLVATLAGGQPDNGLLRLADGAAGNPLYVTELVAALIRGSKVTVTDTGIATLTAASAPGSLAAAIADRLGFVTGPVREVLRAAALLGTDFAVRDLAAVLGREVADLVPLVDQACAVGVLAGSGPGLGFRHPLIRAALYEEMPVAVRAAWHRDAGRALAGIGAPADRVARQLLRAMDGPGGPSAPAAAALVDEWMLGWLDRTAGSLVGQAPGVAADLLTRAGVRVPAGPRRDRLAAQLADALYRTGDRSQAEQVASHALTQATDIDAVVDLHWTLAQCRMLAGSWVRCLASLDQALAAPGLTARHRARLMVLAARTHCDFGEAARAGQIAATALEAATEASDTWAMAWALHVLTLVTAMQGRQYSALPLFERALAVTESDPALTDLRLLLQLNQALVLGNLGRYDEALTLARGARQVASQVGTTLRLTQARSALGQLLFETGWWDAALAEVTALDEDVREPGGACCDLGIAAVICFHRGETGMARQRVAAAVPYAKLLSRRVISPLLLARSLDREQDGSLPEALAVLTDVCGGDIEDLEEIEDLLADAVRIAVKIGDAATARALAHQVNVHATGSGVPHREADTLYCRGLLDHDAAGLLAAADRYAAASRPLQRAKALEAAAREFAHAGQRDRARTAFAGAVEAYTALDAAADLARLNAASR